MTAEKINLKIMDIMVSRHLFADIEDIIDIYEDRVFLVTYCCMYFMILLRPIINK